MTAEYWLQPTKIVKSQRRSPKLTKSAKIAEECQRLPTIAEDRQRLLKIAKDCQRSLDENGWQPLKSKLCKTTNFHFTFFYICIQLIYVKCEYFWVRILQDICEKGSASTLVSQRWTNFCSKAWKLIWINFGTQSKVRDTAFRISKKNWGVIMVFLSDSL